MLPKKLHKEVYISVGGMAESGVLKILVLQSIYSCAEHNLLVLYMRHSAVLCMRNLSFVGRTFVYEFDYLIEKIA